MSPEMPQASFSALIHILAEQALVALGGPHPLIPADKLPPPDPAAARFLVDLLGILKERTAGNVSPEETRELEDVLFALRMRIVNLQHAAPGQTGRPQGD